MVRISPDVGRNRLLIELRGRPTAEHLALGHAQLDEALRRLKPPVDVLSDVRHLEALDEALFDEFVKVGRLLRDYGARRVVRVVGKSAQAAVHMERLARRIHHAAHLAYSLEEAEQVFTSR